MTKTQVKSPFSKKDISDLIKCLDEKIALNEELFYKKKIGANLTKEQIETRLNGWKELKTKVELLGEFSL